jgi:hypothetical protein
VPSDIHADTKAPDANGRLTSDPLPTKLLNGDARRSAQCHGELKRRIILPVLNLREMGLRAADLTGKPLKRYAAVYLSPKIERMGFLASRHGPSYNPW